MHCPPISGHTPVLNEAAMVVLKMIDGLLVVVADCDPMGKSVVALSSRNIRKPESEEFWSWMPTSNQRKSPTDGVTLVSVAALM
jgi:hypothetical protein